MMDFTVSRGTIGDKKSGILSFNKRGIKQATPCFLLNTRCGLVHHLTSDVLRNHCYPGLLPAICHVPMQTIVHQPGTEVMKNCKNAFREFCGMQEYVMMCSMQDLADAADTHKYNETKSVSIWTSSGRTKIVPEAFMELVAAFQFDLVQCMSDVIPKGQTAKRCKKSVDRSLAFLDACLTLKTKQIEAGLSELCLLGVVTGGDNERERVRSAVETSTRDIQGMVFAGFDQLADGDAMALLKASTKAASSSRIPFFLPGQFSPGDIIDAVRRGIDVFDSSFVSDATERGCALCFRYSVKRRRDETTSNIVQQCKAQAATAGLQSGESLNEIKLSEERYTNDFSSLADGCQCYVCMNHSRAYVKHLLVTKEMLAPVLLTIHNLFHFAGFFDEMRYAINDGTLDDFETLVNSCQ